LQSQRKIKTKDYSAKKEWEIGFLKDRINHFLTIPKIRGLWILHNYIFKLFKVFQIICLKQGVTTHDIR